LTDAAAPIKHFLCASTTVPPVSVEDPPLARLVGHRPDRGAAAAARAVVGDVRALVRAEVELAKAEVADGIKAKLLGAGLFIAVAVIGWLALQVLLVFLGFLFALFLPGWAAVGLVLLLLLVAMGVLGFLGYRKLQRPASLEVTKGTVERSKAATQEAVDRAKANAAEGAEAAKAEVVAAVEEVRRRVEARTGRTLPGPTLDPGPEAGA
jgi:uncharacterized membrane protein YqjE